MRASGLVVVLVSVTAFADPPSAEQMAKLQHDVEKAQAESDKKYQGRELSPEDRKQQIKDRAAAENGVLEKAGVDRKDYARASAKLSKDDRAALESEKAKLDKKDKGGADTGGGKEIVIEKGGQPATDADEAAAMDKASGYGKGGSKKRK